MIFTKLLVLGTSPLRISLPMPAWNLETVGKCPAAIKLKTHVQATNRKVLRRGKRETRDGEREREPINMYGITLRAVQSFGRGSRQGPILVL